MKTTFYTLTALIALGGCRSHDADNNTAPDDTVVGSWKLTTLQCNCPPGQPVPDEAVTFDSSQHFELFRDGKLAAQGTYAFRQGSPCGGSGSVALIELIATVPTVYVPKGAYTLSGRQLIIDQCLAADGPRYTYTRQ